MISITWNSVPCRYFQNMHDEPSTDCALLARTAPTSFQSPLKVGPFGGWRGRGIQTSGLRRLSGISGSRLIILVPSDKYFPSMAADAPTNKLDFVMRAAFIRRYQAKVNEANWPGAKELARAAPGVEPGTSRTLSENQTIAPRRKGMSENISDTLHDSYILHPPAFHGVGNFPCRAIIHNMFARLICHW